MQRDADRIAGGNLESELDQSIPIKESYADRVTAYNNSYNTYDKIDQVDLESPTYELDSEVWWKRLSYYSISFACVCAVFLWVSSITQTEPSFPPPFNPTPICYVDTCCPGYFNDPYTQLPFKLFTTDEGVLLPYYGTHNLDEPDMNNNVEAEMALVIVPGYGRNSNQFFCSGYEAWNNVTRDNSTYTSSYEWNDTVIITPQYLVDGDLCWNSTGHMHTINTTDNPPVDCGLPTWTSSSWIDGDLCELPVSDSIGTPFYLYSYDFINIIINRLSDRNYFPNIKNITVFGFSAGAQVTQRYALQPKVELGNDIHLRFVISSPSSFAYFDERRPFTNETLGIGIPNATFNSSWIPMQWEYNTTDSLWITDFDDGCQSYNDWRYGFNELTGYMLNLTNFDPNTTEVAVKEYVDRDITFMVGVKDVCNCYLNLTVPECFLDGVCQDWMLDNSCSAMLQGYNRFNRMVKFYNYLRIFFQDSPTRPDHKLFFANVGHFPQLMMNSPEGICALFRLGCDNISLVENLEFDVDDIWVTETMLNKMDPY